MIDDRLVNELKHCGEVLLQLAEALNSETVTSASKTVETTESETPVSEPTISMEEIRAAMARKIQTGGTEQIKVLLSKYGAAKLSDVNSEQYASLMKDVEGLP